MDHNSLIDEYLRTVITRDSRQTNVFSSWLVMQDMKLARDLARLVSDRIGHLSPGSGLLVLADSGIPLGVLCSQALSQPLYFYRRKPWDIDDEPVPHSIFPTIARHARVIQIDSHLGTGHTSSTCHDLVLKGGASVDAIVSAVSFQSLVQDEIETRPVPYVSMADAARHQETLQSLLACSSPEKLPSTLSEARRRAHSIRFHKQDSDGTGYLPSWRMKGSAMARGLLRKQATQKYPVLSDQLSEQLHQEFGSTESEIWRFFTLPKLVRQASKKAGEEVNLDQFDVIVGTGYLGTFLALCLAWHNGFTGSILSSASPLGWDQTTARWRRGRYLICAARLRTGYYTLGAVRLLERYGVEPSQLLVLRMAAENVAFPRNRILRELGKRVSNIIVLS